MSFTRVKPAGWAFGEKLTSTQMNTLDLDHSRAVDGNAGGNYTPSSVISVLGAGFGDCDVATGSSFTFKGGTWPKLNSRQISVAIPLVPSSFTSGWTFTNGLWVQSNVTGTQTITFGFHAPRGTLDNVLVYLDGNGGGSGHGALPATMPSASLGGNAFSDGTSETIKGVTNDSSASVGAYEISHSIQLTPTTTHTVTGLQHYTVYVNGEAGANAVNNALRLNGIVVTCTVTELRND